MEPQLATLDDLTHVALLTNAQLQSGGHGITFADVYAGIDNGDLWKTLKAKMPAFDRYGLFTGTSSSRPGLVIASLRKVAESIRGAEEKADLTDDHGLALLLALVLEAIEKRHWTAKN